MNAHGEFDTIVVLGAARSGTKLLRDLIGSSAITRTIGYDVNYVWRWGNEGHPDDVLDRNALSDRQVDAIRRKLWALGRPRGAARSTLVEKTVSNVLRIPYVRRVLPRARYVYLIRDGRDVVESAMRSWRESSSLRTLLPKMRTFPWVRSGRYALRYGRAVIERALGRGSHLRTWGPVYPGMSEDAIRLPLLEVCAKQWLACVDAFDRDRATLPGCHIVRYENLIADPSRVTQELGVALGVPDVGRMVGWATANIAPGRVGQHRVLPPGDRERLDVLLGEKLEAWGFARHG